MKYLITLFCILLFCAAANAQNCTSLDECNAKLIEASKIINKLLDVNEAQNKVIEAQKSEIASRTKEKEISDEIIKKQQELNKLLEKQTKSQVSLLFGLIKIRL